MSISFQSLWGVDNIVNPANEQVFPIKGADGAFGLITVGELRTFFNGTVDTSGAWGVARTITLSGGIATGFVSLDGSQNVSFPVDINDNSLSIAKTIGLASLLLGLRLDVDAAATAASSFRYVGYKTDHNFLPGMVITKGLDNEWTASNAATPNLGNVQAIVTELTDANSFILCILGRVILTVSEWFAITGEAGGLSPHLVYYLDVVNGKITKNEPTTGISQTVLYAENATTAIFHPGEVFDVTPGASISGPTTADYATEAGIWATTRSFTLTGGASGTTMINGGDDIILNVTYPNNAFSVANTAGLQATLDALQVDVEIVSEARQANSAVVNQPLHDLIPGMAIYKDGLEWKKANAGNALTTGVAIVGKVYSQDSFLAVQGGFWILTEAEWNAVIVGATSGLPGGYLYLSTVDGKLTTTAPETGIKQFYLTCDTSTRAVVQISDPVLLDASNLSGAVSYPVYVTTLNPSDKSAAITLSGGNLTATKSAAGASHEMVRATSSRVAGKWYYEFLVNSDDASRYVMLGMSVETDVLASFPGGSPWGGVSLYGNTGTIFRGGTNYFSTLFTFTAGDVIGIAHDADARKIAWSKNGTWYNGADPSNGRYNMCDLPGGLFPALSIYSGSSVVSVTARFARASLSQALPTAHLPWNND